MEHEQPSRADKPSDLREQRTGHAIRKHVHGDVGHDRVEAVVIEGELLGNVGHQEPRQRPELGARLRDGLARQIDRRDRVTLTS
jgi:hypothetical protein